MNASNNKNIMLKRIIKIICFLVIFICIMAFLNFSVVVLNTESRKAWNNYSKKDYVDTLFVGSSVGSVVDANWIENLSDYHCINMSTPNQLYKTSYSAIKYIAGQKDLQRVVLITEFDTMEGYEDYVSDKLFRDALYMNSPITEKLEAGIDDRFSRYSDADFWKSSDSINIWFNWVMCPAKTWESIKDIYNTRKKELSGKPANSPANNIFSDANRYTLKKYVADSQDKKALNADLKELSDYNIKTVKVDTKALDYLSQILCFLKANDIEVYVMISPHRLDDRQRYGEEYDTLDKYFKHFVKKRGAKYINLDDEDDIRDILDNNDYFKDSEHITEQGSVALAPVILELMEEEK